MRRAFRFILIIATALAMSADIAHGVEKEDDATLGDMLKKLFQKKPSPTPKPKKKTIRKRASPSPEETASPAETAGAETSTASPTPAESAATESPPPVETPHEQRQPHYFAPVRAMSPGPRSRRQPPSRSLSPPQEKVAEPNVAEPVLTPGETPESRPMPSLPATTAASTSPVKTPASSVTPETTPTTAATNTDKFKPLIPTDQIAESPSYPPQVRKIVDYGLYLAARHLPYKYASADPGKGGMDCSGFIYYVLTQSGIADAPRDAREQYAWVRKAGNFKAVLAQRDDTFELDDLQPGDLLFWASNFGVSRDPEIIQTMIYIGRDKTTNARLMVGAAEHGALKGQPKSGVSAFDFKVGRLQKSKSEENAPVFVGYGHIPSLASK